MITDEERIAKRDKIADYLLELKARRAISLTSEMVLHDECVGTGRVNGKFCLYCNGSGRQIKYSATLFVPYRQIE